MPVKPSWEKAVAQQLEWIQLQEQSVDVAVKFGITVL